MTNNKGITLIALVITIIVLLILAGVSIAMLTGQNGILNQAQSAASSTEIAGIKEKVEIAIQSAYTAKLAANPGDTTELSIEAVATQYQNENTGSTATVSGTTLTIKDGKDYTVTVEKSGKVFKVTDVKGK